MMITDESEGILGVETVKRGSSTHEPSIRYKSLFQELIIHESKLKSGLDSQQFGGEVLTPRAHIAQHQCYPVTLLHIKAFPYATTVG